MISVGILTYNAPKTLKRTLESYSNLIKETDDLFVIIQYSDKQSTEQKVCESFGIRSVCLKDNGKMAWGFKAICENAKHENVLFLENDFVIKSGEKEVKSFMKNCMHFLTNGADLVRGRSRTNPGNPNHAYINLRHFSKEKMKHNTHLSESIYWLQDPEKVYSNISLIEPIDNDGKWYVTSSKYCNYTNNPFACKKDFFTRTILPFIQFGKNLESELTVHWSKQDYKCVFGPGLFTHDRLDGH
jgi:glycosyltransferase involved in cell wall biosynthesis